MDNEGRDSDDDADGDKPCHDPKENDAVLIGLTLGEIDAVMTSKAVDVTSLGHERFFLRRALVNAS